MNGKIADFFSGALIGGSIATLVTLLYTTKKGEQIRENVTEKYNDLKEKAKDKLDTAHDAVEKGVDKVKK